MDYIAIKQRLKYRNEELVHRLESIKNDFVNCDDLDDVLFSIAHETKLELANVKQAIEKIDQNKFGICQSCGNQIDMKSLLDNPFQTICEQCLQQAPE